jgi:hypothetical protein
MYTFYLNSGVNTEINTEYYLAINVFQREKFVFELKTVG